MEDRVQEAKEEGIRQGIWLCIQRLVHMEQYDMEKHFIRSFGFDRNECEMLLDKNGSDDKMESFIIQMVFNKGDKIILDDIGYHKIGSIFKYNIDSKEVELEVLNPVTLVVKDAHLIIVRIITVRIPIVLM